MDFSKALSTADACVGQYINERRQMTESFVEAHFTLERAIEVQKKTVLLDLLFYPVNALWSIPYLSLRKTIETLDKIGWTKFNKALEVIPSGFKTRYQKATEKLLAEEFLQIEKFTENITRELEGVLTPEDFSRLKKQILTECAKEIEKYTASQVLVSDITSTVLTLLVGRLFFGDSNLDILGIGSRIAHKMARDSAANSFFLGKGLGSVFYRVVPVEPSRTQIFLSTLAVGFFLTGFSLVTSVLSDPLRKKLGLHQKKLSSLLSHLEERLFLLIKNELKQADPAKASLKQIS